jgi:hypothetical protein
MVHDAKGQATHCAEAPSWDLALALAKRPRRLLAGVRL